MTDNQNTQPTQTKVPSEPDTQADSSTSVPNDAKNLGLFAAGGALAGPFIGMGLVAGAVVGTAAYGVKRALFDSPTDADPGQPITVETVTNTVSHAATQTVNTVSAWAGQTASWINKKIKDATVTAADPKQPSTVATVTKTVSHATTQTVDTVSKWAGQTATWINKKVKDAAASSGSDATRKT